eukprot:4395230-Amphidinium_carterae.1
MDTWCGRAGRSRACKLTNLIHAQSEAKSGNGVLQLQASLLTWHKDSLATKRHAAELQGKPCCIPACAMCGSCCHASYLLPHTAGNNPGERRAQGAPTSYHSRAQCRDGKMCEVGATSKTECVRFTGLRSAEVAIASRQEGARQRPNSLRIPVTGGSTFFRTFRSFPKILHSIRKCWTSPLDMESMRSERPFVPKDP